MKLSIKKANWLADKSKLREIRTTVFVNEQSVPLELELDDHDSEANHWLAYDDDQAIGCCRMLRDGHIGRMAVLSNYRGNGVGTALLTAATNQAKADELFEVYLYSQTQAVSFYQRADFVVSGEEFMDAGMPHRTMRLQLKATRQLGIDGGNFSVENFRETAVDLIKQTTKQLRVLSYDLDHKTFDNREMEQLLSSLARNSRYTEIRILIVDPRSIISRGHRLLRLQRRLSSSILLRKSSALPHDIKNNLIIADHNGIICQSIKEPENIWANFNNRPSAENYIAQFDDLWERGTEDRNLRQLEI